MLVVRRQLRYHLSMVLVVMLMRSSVVGCVGLVSIYT